MLRKSRCLPKTFHKVFISSNFSVLEHSFHVIWKCKCASILEKSSIYTFLHFFHQLRCNRNVLYHFPQCIDKTHPKRLVNKINQECKSSARMSQVRFIYIFELQLQLVILIPFDMGIKMDRCRLCHFVLSANRLLQPITLSSDMTIVLQDLAEQSLYEDIKLYTEYFLTCIWQVS